MRKMYLTGAASLLACVAMSAEGMSGGGSCPGVMTLAGALHSLDPKDDGDWTEGGLPSMGRLKVLTGNERLTRAEVSEAFPGFDRADASKGNPPTVIQTSAPAATVETLQPQPDPLGEVVEGLTKAVELLGEMAELTAADKPDDDDRPDGPAMPTADQIADFLPDAVMLLEALCIVAGSERYSRNSSLQTIVRGYQVAQREIKDVQGRLDARAAQRQAQRAGDTSNG